MQSPEQLEDFLLLPEAADIVGAASFEEVFFAIKGIGLADALDLLPLVKARQIRGFIDLDCWRKDTFVRRPLMEWLAAFMQAGPEDAVRALSSIDDTVIALFLKDIITVFETERDEPPPRARLVFSSDNRFGVEIIEEGEAATMAMLILDALFKYYPALGTKLLTLVRYTTRIELEETAYENKRRRLEVYGFVDYYDALSIYSGHSGGEFRAARNSPPSLLPEEGPGTLPAVFADSLSGSGLLLRAFRDVRDPERLERIPQELTALANRVLSANLVNLGDLENVRPALEEIRDYLTIGLEHLTAGSAQRAGDVMSQSLIQAIFQAGFGQVAQLRDRAEQLIRKGRIHKEALDLPEQEFLDGLCRFKPLFFEEGRYRGFASMADVAKAAARLEELGGR